MELRTDAFFVSERRWALSRKTAWLMIRSYGERAGLPLPAHPPMVRHACGFALADQGADTRLIRLFRTPEYATHRPVHRHQPGTV